ncbi:MAG: hypothetical protein L3J70_03700 [Gammaproteobacteria bacterium]|nr:hypothetical protein [Gammaproteobacteria bacterium]
MNNWHFPRPQLAKHYLNILALGISSNLAIIAPRRKGKTLFVLQDLSPLAQKNEYLPVYASLWQNINAPHEGLILALEDAIEALDKRSPISRLLKAKIKRTTVSNELLGKMEVEFADKATKVTSKELLFLERLLAELQKKAGKKTVLLLIDEVQHLATSPLFDPLTHALRTMLDKRQGCVKTIFTGSSRHYMNLLFNESQSPFYHFVETVPFPDLGDEFIDFLVTKLEQEHSISISQKSLSKVFDAIDQSPYWMMKLITYILTSGSNIKSAQEYILELLEAAEGFEDIAKRMKVIDRIVFLALSEGDNPFSKELLSKIDKETSVKGIPSNIQRSIKRLAQKNLISQMEKGRYYIEKPGLKRYLLEESSR